MQAQCAGLQCRECGKIFPQGAILKCPECDSPLRVLFEPTSLKTALKNGLPAASGQSYLRRWHDILPIAGEALIDRVSLGETQTALLPSRRIGGELGIGDLRFKIEEGPTLSLKDRGSALCVLKALEYGADTVCVASSGNNASSVSAYGARAGLRPVVFVQKQVSPAKIFKMTTYGGNVCRIDGGMAEASKICDEMVKNHGWFQCGGPNPYRVCGKRTFAYEITEQLGKEPDALLIPCGGGAGMVAAWDAFREMLECGLISRLPRLFGVQLEACDPIAQAFNKGLDYVPPVKRKTSLSDAIMNANPYWGKYCLKAARESGGGFITITDDDFIRAIRKLGECEGIFAEPAGAATTAALERFVKTPQFLDCNLVVCDVTGHGLNAPAVAANESNVPEPLPPDAVAVETFLTSRLAQA